MWDVNWPAFDVLNEMSTQWRVGVGGATGLDYAAFPVVASLLGYKKKHHADIFQDLRIMENEALITMGENRKDANDS